MAIEQLPPDVYVVDGKDTLAGYILPEQQYDFEEDGEPRYDGNGRFTTELAYSRRPTLNVTLHVLSATTPAYHEGGEIVSGVFADGAGNATAWKIQPGTTLTKTRGPWVVNLQLIAQNDLLA